MDVELHPEADTEFIEAAQRYESRVPGLGSRFIDELEGLKELLRERPEIGVRITKPFRRVVFRKFPFSLIYSFEESFIWVVAVGAVRYEATLDLAKGTIRCNCSICKKARAWFTFVGGKDFHLLKGEDAMSSYQWTPRQTEERVALHPAGPFLTYRFCKTCGIRVYATGDAEFMGGRFYALAVSTLDDVTTDELASAPLKVINNLHDRFDRAPADTRLM